MYFAPDSLDEAVDVLREHGSDGKILAGGQSLVPMMNMRLARPSALIDVMRITHLSGIHRNGRLSVGATTRQRDVLADAGLTAEFPLIHAALRSVGHPANRARGTFGGSLAHADPAAELPAVMLALDAEMAIQGRNGERVVSAEDFFVTYYTTVLDADDLLTEIRLPKPPSAWGFREITRRHGDFALAGAVITADADAAGLVQSARVVLFAVTDRPVRAVAAEEALVGQRLADDAVVREVAELACEGIDFTSDVHVSDVYRREASVALVRRAVQDAATSIGG